jgi:hypothetical protein
MSLLEESTLKLLAGLLTLSVIVTTYSVCKEMIIIYKRIGRSAFLSDLAKIISFILLAYYSGKLIRSYFGV